MRITKQQQQQQQQQKPRVTKIVLQNGITRQIN